MPLSCRAEAETSLFLVENGAGGSVNRLTEKISREGKGD